MTSSGPGTPLSFTKDLLPEFSPPPRLLETKCYTVAEDFVCCSI